MLDGGGIDKIIKIKMKHIKELKLNENIQNKEFFNRLENEKQYTSKFDDGYELKNVVETLKKLTFIEFTEYEIKTNTLMVNISEHQSLTSEDLLILSNCESFRIVTPVNNKLRLTFRIN